MIDGIFAVGHRFDRHDPLVRHLRRRIAAKLAERPFVAGLRRDLQFSFEHDLRKSRHLQVDGPALDDIDRLTGEAAGDFQLEHSGARLELRRDVNRRRHADAYGDFEIFLAALLGVFYKIVAVMSRREANGDFVFRYQHHSVDREVVAVLRVFDNDMARRNVRPAVARVVGAQRQFRDVDFAPLHDDFLARTVRNQPRRNRLRRAPDGLVENIFLRQSPKPEPPGGHSPKAGRLRESSNLSHFRKAAPGCWAAR